MKRTLLSLTVAAIFLAPLAHADDASKRAKVEELLVITKDGDNIKQLSLNMIRGMKQNTDREGEQMHMTPDQKKMLTDYQGQLEGIITDAVGWDKVKPSVIDNYMASYTEPELDGILAFYKSPSGQAMLQKNPKIVNTTMDLMKKNIQEVQPQLQTATKDFQDKLRKTMAPPAGSPAAPSLGPTAPAPSTSSPAPKAPAKP